MGCSKNLYIFPMALVMKILQIVNLPTIREDKLIWAMEKSSNFSVKSTYKMIYENHARIEGESSINLHSFWKGLWKTMVPSKIKIMAWRACHNCLPTMKQLFPNKIIVDDTCGICKAECEDVDLDAKTSGLFGKISYPS